MRGRNWTAAEDEILLAGLAAGHTHARIAAATRRPTSSIGSRIETLVYRAPERLAQAETAGLGSASHAASHAPLHIKNGGPGERRQRRCLCCGKEFASAHAGNRLCNGCRTKPTSPYAP